MDQPVALATSGALSVAGLDLVDGDQLLDHLDGILNYCRTKVPMGVVEAVNGNIKSLLRRGRGYKNLRYLLLKAQRMAATRTEFVVFRKAA